MSSTNSRILGNRAQMSQVFIFFMAVIVIVATVFLGMKLLGVLTGTACDVSSADFQIDLHKILDANSNFGSRGIARLRAPCNAQQLCFVDAGAINKSGFWSNHSSIQNAIRVGVRENIFVILDAGMVDDYDERIILRDPGSPVNLTDLCILQGNGEFVFRTEGYGRFIKVTE